MLSRCRSCRTKATQAWRDAHPGAQQALNKKLVDRNRRVVMEHYSSATPSCACCGEAEYLFLALDHIYNDGYLDRRPGPGRSRAGFYAKIIKDGFPPRFQVLCHNCNHAKRFGECPHKKTQR